MKAKKVVSSLVVSLLLLLTLGPVGTVGADEEVKIGILQALTGDLGTYGGPMTDAMKLAIKEANENGGVLNQTIVAIVEDTETSEVKANDAANKLVNVDKVPAIIGTTSSGPSMAIIGVTTGSDVLQISSSNTAPDFTTYEDNDLFFRTCPSDKLQGLAMARLAINEGYMNVSTIVINNAYGVGFEDVFTQEFEELGGTVVESIKYDPAGTIFDSEVEKACGNEPDFVMLCAYPETGSIVLKTAYEKGYMEDIDWLLSEGLKDDTLAELAGKDESGTFIIAGLKGTAPDTRVTGPAYETFKDKFTKEYGKNPTTYCSHSYDAAAVVILAMEHSGSANGPDISSSMRDISNAPGEEVTEISEALKLIREGKEINYQGASSEITFDENGDVLGSYAVWSIGEYGSTVFGDPIDLTTADEPVAIETEDVVEEPTATVEEEAETTEEPAMDEEETSTPGFESTLALVGLLAVGLFVSRRRRN